VEDAVSRFASSRGYAVVFFYNDASDADEKYSQTNVMRKVKLPAAVVPIYIANQVDISASIAQVLNAMYPIMSLSRSFASFQETVHGAKRSASWTL
jgi:hypothetical protein